MKRNSVIFLVLIVSSNKALAQLDAIQELDKVVLNGSKLVKYSAGNKVEKLNDSIIDNNSVSLTGLLAFNSNIYFKESGFGMVSSPSFRGTNASQTAVVWNGININSQLNGQTDFNTINTANFSTIDVRSGGGSVQYGSGAIGGSIHLNNNLEFTPHLENRIRLSYASFNTKMTNMSTSFGDAKFSTKIGVAYTSSDNDYKYLGTELRNENGAFNNLNLSLTLGCFISEKDILKIYHQSYDGVRHFSRTLAAPSNTKYEDENYRTMLEWAKISGAVSSKLRAVHLKETFKFFENKNKPIFSSAKVNTYLLKHDFNLSLSHKLQFKSILELDYFKATGSSFGNANRSAFSATALMNHKLSKKIEYNLNLRKDFTSDFSNPFLFSIDCAYAISKPYTIFFNASKNYRIPTFNDLFWQSGGNLDLEPESSYQLDLGGRFSSKNLDINLNGYYINTKKLIQWRPDNLGDWKAVNVANSHSYGLELEAKSQIIIGKENFSFSMHYSYTVSENLETKKQLIYVPFHKGNISLGYYFKSFTVLYQHLLNGEVFIIGNKLDGFNVANMGVSRQLNKKGKVGYKIDFRINNMYNKNYQNVALRPMPSRNYQILATIKF